MSGQDRSSRDVEMTRLIDHLLTAEAAARAIGNDMLVYLIGVAIAEARSSLKQNHK